MTKKFGQIISGIVGGIVLGMMGSCDRSGTIYYRYQAIEGGEHGTGWYKDAPCVFDVEVSDTTKLYDVILAVRHNNEYKYQNLYLFVNSTSPEGITHADTLNYMLANERGEWIGGGIGSKSTLPLLYMKGIIFPRAGVYHFEVKQGMRETTLEGITDMGLRVALSGEQNLDEVKNAAVSRALPKIENYTPVKTEAPDSIGNERDTTATINAAGTAEKKDSTDNATIRPDSSRMNPADSTKTTAHEQE